MAWPTKVARLFVGMMWVVLSVALLGCGGSILSTGEGGIDAAADGHSKTEGGVMLTALQVTPATASIAIGTTQQFTATAIFNDGLTQDVSATATWSSSDMATVTIDGSGLARALAGGITTITAKDTIGGTSQSGTATLTVLRGGLLRSITVTPPNATVAPGTTQQFTATGGFADGTTQDLTATATWASSDGAVATIDATGLAAALTTGTTTISASRGGITGRTTLLADHGGPPALEVTPPTAVTRPGCADVPFKATVNTMGGGTMDVTTMAAWTSSDPTIATVGAATGIATPLRFGTVTISATYAGQNGTATLTVGGGGLVSVAVTPATPSIPVGSTQQFKATVACTDGTAADVTSLASWTSSSLTTATISATGLATGVAKGTSTITATLGTVSGTANLTVGTPACSITVTPNPAAGIAGGASVPFKATEVCSDGTSTDVTNIAAWTSSAPAVATVGAAMGLAVPLSVGFTTITATLGGMTGTATLTVM
jgi:uncharacterized protein YjdB